MSRKQTLLLQLAACHDTKNWFAPLNQAVQGLSAHQAEQRITPDGHSVRQLVNHIIFWNNWYLAKFNGEGLAPMGDDYDSFTDLADTWEATAARADQVMAGWRQAIATADEQRLDAPVTPGRDAIWADTISHLILHTAHHTGQIVTVRRELGLWDPALGVV